MGKHGNHLIAAIKTAESNKYEPQILSKVCRISGKSHSQNFTDLQKFSFVYIDIQDGTFV